MLYSVGAQQEIAALCPDRDLSRLGELMSGKAVTATETGAKIPLILSDWFERAEALRAASEGRDYTMAPLSWELIEMLSVEQFNRLIAEALQAMARDSGRLVEAEPDGKKKEAPQAPEGPSN